MIRVMFAFIWLPFISFYSKLIGWVIERVKYAAAGGDQAFLMVVIY